MSVTNPVTQRDVAIACGLHPSTVCLALKNSPSIPESTRRRVQACAEELGYSPNVAARNLALLRSERKATAALPIAWINQEARRDHWRVEPEARAYYEAARRRAEETGYHLEEFWTQEAGMSPARLVQILKARGVDGVLFPVHRSFDFALLSPAWNDFALVGFNDLRLGEWLDVVSPDYYRNTGIAMRELQRLGFTHVALALSAQFDAATNGLVRSSFLRWQADMRETFRAPVLYCTGAATSSAVENWLRAHRPDAIVCHEPVLAALLQDAPHAAPVVQLGAGLATSSAGIDVGAAEIAGAAVDTLVTKMRRFEKGFREATRFQTIRGTWNEGALVAAEIEPVVA